MPGFASSLTYQRGGLLRQVTHANGVAETIAVDPQRPFDRPYRITTSGVTSGDWDSGIYRYDGSGNVKRIGEQHYRYDKVSRLLEGTVEVDGEFKTQSLSYDPFGNLLSLTTDGVARSTPVDSASNRLTGGTYDAGGNLVDITLDGERYLYTYDPLNMMKHLQSTNDQARVFLYDADDERVMTFDCALVECATQTSRLTTTIRGLDGKVLRVYNFDFGEPWQWVRDYVYREGQLLASVQADETEGETTSHFHLDHLGSPRQITDGDAIELAFHSYYPFGEEATDPSQSEGPLKFTGHERDQNGSTGSGQLDYMHARYCGPSLGRFLSPDPIDSVQPERPQTWNKYAYGNNNPTRFFDPNGESALSFVAKLLFKGGNVGLTAAGIVSDFRALTGSGSSFGERVFAGASLASEALPISGRDAVAIGTTASAVVAGGFKRLGSRIEAASVSRGRLGSFGPNTVGAAEKLLHFGDEVKAGAATFHSEINQKY